MNSSRCWAMVLPIVLSPAPHRQGDVVMAGVDPLIAGTLKGFGVTGVRLAGPREERALLPIPVSVKPGVHQVDWVTASGPVSLTVTVEALSAVVETLKVASMTSKTPKVLEKENKALAKKFHRVMPSWMGTGSFGLPCDGRITSGFGESRVYNDGLVAWRHTGVDFGMKKGGSRVVKAAQSGQVSEVKSYQAHGGTVVIDHGCGIQTVYLHLASFKVKKGKKVKVGDQIGVMGQTGLATGIHLHWGAKVGGVTVNPLALLSLSWPRP